MSRVATLDLERRVANRKALREVASGVGDKGIIQGGAGPHQVRRERRLRRAHGPDVQVVHFDHAGQALEMALHGVGVDTGRGGIEREVHRIPAQSPGAVEDYQRDRDAGRRIEPQPAGRPLRQGRQHDAKRHAGIGRHVQEGAADVEIAVAAAHEEEGGATVDQDADAGDPDHRHAGDLRGRVEAAHRFHQDAADAHQQQSGVDQRGHDRGAAEPVAAARGRLAPAKPRRTPGQHETRYVGEVVGGIGQQGERVGGETENDFGHH